MPIVRWRPVTRVLAAVLLLACAGSTPVQVPTPPQPENLFLWWGGVPGQPTTLHAYIYRAMLECLEIEDARPFEDIQWISAQFLLRISDYQRLGGLWIGSQGTIVLDQTRFNEPRVVSEELLHSLLPPPTDGSDPHDNKDFIRCLITPYVAP